MGDSTVLVVGAGPTGMTAAIELKRAGFDVRLIDKSEHMALHSQALVVQARTLEQLQRYGIAADAVSRGRKLTESKIWSEGKLIVSFKLDQIPSRYPFLLFLPQSETEALLNAHMESLGVRAERKVELESLTQHDGGVTATLRHPDGQSEEIAPRWVIGCDGAHSSVREKTGTRFEGHGIGISFFLGDIELEGPDAPRDEISVHLHQGDVVFMGRLSDRLVRLIVALHGKQEKGAQPQLTLEDFQRAVDQAGVRVRVRAAEWMTPFYVNDRQAENYRIDAVFLAGDAAHIHSPVGGQGMNTGMQDVANLAWKLAAIARGADDDLLDSYEEERGAVGKALLKFTERGLNMTTVSNRAVEAVRDTLLPLLTRLKPVQRAAAGFISETAIEYRSSSVVRDLGGDGDLRAGDRLPDLSLKGANGGTTLLGQWMTARHRIFAMNAGDVVLSDLAERISHADVVPLRGADLDEEGRRLLGEDEKLVILRPDGYVGFRGPVDRRSEWLAYARQDGIL